MERVQGSTQVTISTGEFRVYRAKKFKTPDLEGGFVTTVNLLPCIGLDGLSVQKYHCSQAIVNQFQNL